MLELLWRASNIHTNGRGSWWRRQARHGSCAAVQVAETDSIIDGPLDITTQEWDFEEVGGSFQVELLKIQMQRLRQRNVMI